MGVLKFTMLVEPSSVIITRVRHQSIETSIVLGTIHGIGNLHFQSGRPCSCLSSAAWWWTSGTQWLYLHNPPVVSVLYASNASWINCVAWRIHISIPWIPGTLESSYSSLWCLPLFSAPQRNASSLLGYVLHPGKQFWKFSFSASLSPLLLRKRLQSVLLQPPRSEVGLIDVEFPSSCTIPVDLGKLNDLQFLCCSVTRSVSTHDVISKDMGRFHPYTVQSTRIPYSPRPAAV